MFISKRWTGFGHPNQSSENQKFTNQTLIWFSIVYIQLFPKHCKCFLTFFIQFWLTNSLVCFVLGLGSLFRSQQSIFSYNDFHFKSYGIVLLLLCLLLQLSLSFCQQVTPFPAWVCACVSADHHWRLWSRYGHDHCPFTQISPKSDRRISTPLLFPTWPTKQKKKKNTIETRATFCNVDLALTTETFFLFKFHLSFH